LRLEENWNKDLKPDVKDLLHESRTGIWKLWRAMDRKIPEGAKIHKSVIDRIKEIENYNPTLPKDYEVVSNDSYIDR
jgi:hypothetical protein